MRVRSVAICAAAQPVGCAGSDRVVCGQVLHTGFGVQDLRRKRQRRAEEPAHPTPVFVLAALAVILLAAPAAQADEIVLDTGAVYKGKIIERTDKTITFEAVSGGGTMTVKFTLDRIKEIRLGPAPEPGATPTPTHTPATAPSPTPTPKPTPAPASGPATLTADEVNHVIDQAGKTQPDWWNAVKMTQPKTLDLTWKKGEGMFELLSLSEYLEKTIRPDKANWKLGIRVVSLSVDANKDQPEKLRISQEAMGDMYLGMMADYTRAAWWYRQVGNENVDDRLALCYWKLGCPSLASDVLSKHITDPTERLGCIRMWGALGEAQKAIDMAEATAKDKPAQAYLAAGDALRLAGKFDQAVTYYEKIAAIHNLKDDKLKELARTNADLLTRLQKLDLSKVKDGRYSGNSAVGYRGSLSVEVTVKSGKIAAVRVADQKEDQALLALTEIPKRIVAAQGIAGVDAITGATSSSDAVVLATVAALTGTPGGSKYKDGIYTGSARGHKSVIEMQITIKDGKIIDATVTKQADDAAWWNRAKVIVPQIVQNQGTDGVSTVTRATHSSNGILGAAADALSKAKK